MQFRLICVVDSPGQTLHSLGGWEAWKTGLIDVLKNSPSKDRKFLKWDIVRLWLQPFDNDGYTRTVVEAGEMEVLPEPPP